MKATSNIARTVAATPIMRRPQRLLLDLSGLKIRIKFSSVILTRTFQFGCQAGIAPRCAELLRTQRLLRLARSHVKGESKCGLLRGGRPPPGQARERVPALREFGERLGGTTLLEVPSPLGGARVFAKCEWENPAGSVKDRVAYVLLCRLVPGDPETPVEEVHIIEYSATEPADDHADPDGHP
jgi:hypothetical protein